MRAKVTKAFKGKAPDAMRAMTYKVGDTITDARMAQKAVRNKWAEPIGSAAEPKAPANKAEAPPANKGRDVRATAMEPAPVKSK